MIQPDSVFTFTSQRLNLAAARWGDASAPPLILVHGGRDQKRSWDSVALWLAAYYCVYAYDLRGHGASDWVNDGEYGVMDHVFDLASLVQHLDLRRFALIGHSLGGNIALRYAGLYPDRIDALVAIEGLGPSPRLLAERRAEPFAARTRDWIEQRRGLSERAPRRMASLAEAEERMAAAFPHLPRSLIQHLTETGTKTHADGTFSWAYDPAGMGRSPADIRHEDFVQLWTEITCPTWLVYGAASWASNPEEDGRARHFQNATVSVIPEAGHWLHHDQFNAFIDGLGRFLGVFDA